MARFGNCIGCRQSLLSGEMITSKYGVTMMCKNCGAFNFITYRGLLR